MKFLLILCGILLGVTLAGTPAQAEALNGYTKVIGIPLADLKLNPEHPDTNNFPKNDRWKPNGRVTNVTNQTGRTYAGIAAGKDPQNLAGLPSVRNPLKLTLIGQGQDGKQHSYTLFQKPRREIATSTYGRSPADSDVDGVTAGIPDAGGYPIAKIPGGWEADVDVVMVDGKPVLRMAYTTTGPIGLLKGSESEIKITDAKEFTGDGGISQESTPELPLPLVSGMAVLLSGVLRRIKPSFERSVRPA